LRPHQGYPGDSPPEDRDSPDVGTGGNTDDGPMDSTEQNPTTHTTTSDRRALRSRARLASAIAAVTFASLAAFIPLGGTPAAGGARPLSGPPSSAEVLSVMNGMGR